MNFIFRDVAEMYQWHLEWRKLNSVDQTVLYRLKAAYNSTKKVNISSHLRGDFAKHMTDLKLETSFQLSVLVLHEYPANLIQPDKRVTKEIRRNGANAQYSK